VSEACTPLPAACLCARPVRDHSPPARAQGMISLLYFQSLAWATLPIFPFSAPVAAVFLALLFKFEKVPVHPLAPVRRSMALACARADAWSRPCSWLSPSSAPSPRRRGVQPTQPCSSPSSTTCVLLDVRSARAHLSARISTHHQQATLLMALGSFYFFLQGSWGCGGKGPFAVRAPASLPGELMSPICAHRQRQTTGRGRQWRTGREIAVSTGSTRCSRRPSCTSSSASVCARAGGRARATSYTWPGAGILLQYRFQKNLLSSARVIHDKARVRIDCAVGLEGASRSGANASRPNTQRTWTPCSGFSSKRTASSVCTVAPTTPSNSWMSHVVQ
jgi:hypothetical protein